MQVMTARPYNHIGPGQSPQFVSSAFSRQLLAISRGETEPVMHVGNLESRRDFLDVRDVARAYRLILESGQAGQAYNIATGNRLPIRTCWTSSAACPTCTPSVSWTRIFTGPPIIQPSSTFPAFRATSIGHRASRWNKPSGISSTDVRQRDG